jgi:hypothetical protein
MTTYIDEMICYWRAYLSTSIILEKYSRIKKEGKILFLYD